MLKGQSLREVHKYFEDLQYSPDRIDWTNFLSNSWNSGLKFF